MHQLRGFLQPAMNPTRRIRWLLALVVLCTGCGPGPDSGHPVEPAAETAERTAISAVAAPRSRTFLFSYGSTITGLAPGKVACVWVPLASDSPEQQVTLRKVDLPVEHRITREKRFGNELIYFEAAADRAGEVRLELEYVVVRHEVLRDRAEPQVGDLPEAFLAASSLVPVDGTLHRRLLGDQAVEEEPLVVARRIYDAVGEWMSYGKPADLPWGRGDAAWACESGVGNCTDFHSLFVGVARDLRIPARFEMGFLIPPEAGNGEIAGYHCWAWFLAGDRWAAVDISEADNHPDLREYYFGNLTPDRVRFTVGRDLELDPPQQAGPVNFLVYPYVEVDGRPHTAMTNRFTYADMP